MIDFSKLVPLYNEPHRKYHNLKHIHSMLRHIVDVRDNFNDINLNKIIAAIWYHDAYYDPCAPGNMNEVFSSWLFESNYNKPGSQEFAKEVCKIIISTSDHSEHQKNLTLENKIVLDLDLHFLGLSKKEYLINRENIFDEYLCYGVNENDLRNGRIKFLRKLLERVAMHKSLFYTDYFHNKYMKNAFSNIRDELVLLGEI